MTNAEAAALFASLPPGGIAEITILDLDTATTECVNLEVVTEDLLEDIDEDERDEVKVGSPCITRSY